MPVVWSSQLPRRVHRLCVLVTATALLVVACVPAPSRCSVEWVLQQVQVLHRHGSRSAAPSHNITDICGSTPCGYLNPEGETMMRNVGSFLRKRYTTDLTVVDEPFLPSQGYDLDVVASRSTDVLRTLQSAELFLAGMFPDTSRLIPAIHTVPTDEDMMLFTFSQPWVDLYAMHAEAAQVARMNPVVDRYFPDWAVLRDLGKVLWSEDYCSDYARRMMCVVTLFDIAAAKRSVGELPAAAAARYDDLHAIVAAWFRYMWYYDPSNTLSVQQGGRGQLFLQQVLTNIDDFVADRNKFKVMHYSGHDISVAAVWGTLGDSSVYAMQPTYAQTFVLELVKSATTGEHGVRVLRGWPGQSPDTGFTFSWDSKWKLHCRRSDGTSYAAEDNLCPLEDFRRYVAGTAGTDPRGMCLLDAETSAVLSCPTGAAEQTSAVALSASCSRYRAVCPAYACESGYVLSAPDLRCRCASADCRVPGGGAEPVTVQMTGVAGGAAAGIAIATFCLGGLFSVLATVLIMLMVRRRGDGSLTGSVRSDKSMAPDHVEHERM
ncbi:hypothetical protein JKF63_03693 [Porcisia hertigi]|uniref:Membrane-bound acid phosphatase n=1 Tax=Porcisia hertigi TaxID=2761500 RepID=A0A836IH82_9TRYP|nr:hypothetical protein JKF63_03693 [Porcisia hertigi]